MKLTIEKRDHRYSVTDAREFNSPEEIVGFFEALLRQRTTLIRAAIVLSGVERDNEPTEDN